MVFGLDLSIGHANKKRGGNAEGSSSSKREGGMQMDQQANKLKQHLVYQRYLVYQRLLVSPFA